MSTAELLDLIIFQTLNVLQSGNGGRNSDVPIGEERLVELFEVLKSAMDVGNPRLLYPILDGWLAEYSTEPSSLFSQVFDNLIQTTVDVSQEQLSAEQSQQLNSSLLPIYFHANQYLHEHEIKSSIAKFSQEQSSLEEFW